MDRRLSLISLYVKAISKYIDATFCSLIWLLLVTGKLFYFTFHMLIDECVGLSSARKLICNL